jgi:hypothetical protein
LGLPRGLSQAVIPEKAEKAKNAGYSGLAASTM